MPLRTWAVQLPLASCSLARSPRHTRPPEQPLTATAHTLRPPARRPRPVPPVVARPLRPHLALPPAPGSPALAVAPMGKAKSGKKQDNSKAVRPSSLALSTSARIFISVSSSSPSSSRSAGCQSRQEGQAGVQGGQDRHEADQEEEGQGAGQGRGVGGGRLPPLARGAPPKVGRGAQGHRCVLSLEPSGGARRRADAEPFLAEDIVEGPPSRRANATLTASPVSDHLYLFGGEYYDGQRVELFADVRPFPLSLFARSSKR